MYVYIQHTCVCTYVRMYRLDNCTLDTQCTYNACPCTNQTSAHYKFNRVSWWRVQRRAAPVLNIVTDTPTTYGAIVSLFVGHVYTHTRVQGRQLLLSLDHLLVPMEGTGLHWFRGCTINLLCPE